MKFRTRLYWGFGIIILLMTILLLGVFIFLNSLNTDMIQTVEKRYQTIKDINHVRKDIMALDKCLMDYVIEEDYNATEVLLHMQTIRELTNKINLEIDELIKNNKSAKMAGTLADLNHQFISYEILIEQITNTSNLKVKDKQERLLKDSEKEYVLLIQIAESFVNRLEGVIDQSLLKEKAKFTQAVFISFGSIVFGITVGIIITMWITRSIAGRLRIVKDVMQLVGIRSETLPRIQIVANDEIGEIAEAYNNMAKELETYEKMEKAYKNELEAQSWLKTKIAELGELSHPYTDQESLGQVYLQAIANMVEAQYGVLYIKEEVNHVAIYRKLSSFAALEQGKYLNGKSLIKEGEGLIGQCALDQKIKKIDNIPENYLEIRSGLGATSSGSLMLFPIEIEDEVIAVLELASIHPFSKLHEQLLERAAIQLGAILNRIQRQMLVQQLLDEAQILNEELQCQSEELQMQQEELRTMNEELEAQYRTSEEKTLDLEKAKSALEERTRQVLSHSQYKTEFIANISHEFRTPLNSLLILAQMLLENKEGNLTEKQIEYAQTIHSSGKELLELINDILDFSKIESGKIECSEAEINFQELLNFAEKQFKPVAEQKQLDFSVEIDEFLPKIIYSDEQKVYQIIKNLLSNAFKFTEKGHVKVKVFTTFFDSRNNLHHFEKFLVFQVSDTGIGIPREKQGLIFEAFRQADGTTSRTYGGTGLGLSISKDLAELLDGFIKVHSVEGKGSTFSFYLPINRGLPIMENQKEAAASKDYEKTQNEVMKKLPISNENHVHVRSLVYGCVKEESFVGKKILVVDDDMRNIFALTSFLEEMGMLVIFAENGMEALELLKAHPDVSLVLMDIMMPEMDGLEALAKIRSNIEYKNLPIIAITAKAMKNDREKCIEAGATDYIGKPIQLIQLYSLLKMWLTSTGDIKDADK
ncbi:ATP-binding protein [Cytobacillus sp. Hz8]|uniref:ATP-binding protein n=1 Tax=Cytobacillus sp. Hz8 TaxID=3347168 RepID=UPI0035D55623